MTLLSPHWQGSRHEYLFRCMHGHEFGRKATIMLRGTATCLECVRDGVQRRFLSTIEQQGFVNLEPEFLGLTVRHRLTCRLGHEWATEARKIVEGTGCPTCVALQSSMRQGFPDGLERLYAVAAAQGGKCLADTYQGMKARYLWECANRHRWRATGGKVTNGGWCRMCFARRNGDASRCPDGLARLKAVAAAHDGQCLDDVYIGRASKYRFRCANGHEWTTYGHLVLAGTWCRLCANRRRMPTIERMQQIAQGRGGRCLSEEYLGNKIKLTWECSRGHVWRSAPNTVANCGAWCPSCARLRLTFDPLKRKRYDVDG
ncbi:hypothetical protein [Trinickia violacea]|nr:hypothetical protein [Trinickia violacea]